MKKLLLLLVIISLFSCKKDDPDPDPPTTIPPPTTVSCQDCNNLYSKSYLDQYLTTLGVVTNWYDDESDQWMIDSAHSEAGKLVMTCFTKSLTLSYSLDTLLSELQFDQSLTQAQRDGYVSRYYYFELVSPIAWPGSIMVQDCP